jgi:ribonuclease HI
MENDEIPEIDLYSDGGAEPNPGKGGFGVIMSYKGRKREFNQGYLFTTNNRMELMGVIHGLERLKTKSIVNVFTDSRYVIDGITQGWAEKWKSRNWFRTKNSKAINQDLWAKLLDLISKQEEVRFKWIKGHAGHSENERCDLLAGFALKGESLLEDTGYCAIEKLTEDNSEETIQSQSKKMKVENEGDLCRKCSTEVIKRQTKKHDLKPNQTYYFEYHLYCPSCKTTYMVEDAKRDIKKQENNLFS